MKQITEKKRRIDIKGKYQTIVVGGGIAGIAAALAAARNGNKVLLIEKNFILGGLATAGLVTIYLPLCDGNGRQVSFGIAEELLRLSIRYGIEDRSESTNAWLNNGTIEERKKYRFEVQYNPYVFAIGAEQLLIAEGVELLYGTSVCNTVVKNSKITHILVENKSGRLAYALENIIDTSGDADVCKLAGEDTVTFKQGNIPAGWYYYTENGLNNLKMLGFSDIPDNQKTKEQLENDKLSLRFGGLDAEELTKLTVYSHNMIINDFLNKGNVSPVHSLSTIATVPQIRMTRRICGVSTPDDTDLHKEFFDSVGLFSDWRKSGPVYELPFSALCGKKIKNLVTAGRCISVTDGMWDITRVIPVCAVSGEAAGTAASLTNDFTHFDITHLQKRLISNGIILHEKDLKQITN